MRESARVCVCVCINSLACFAALLNPQQAAINPPLVVALPPNPPLAWNLLFPFHCVQRALLTNQLLQTDASFLQE